MLVNRIEQRILVGTVAFLVTLVLVGWIAINEGGRMAAFDKQFLGRSIESGAMLFAANCSTCHGTDGRGSPKGPALNSPFLFGHDYLAEIHREREDLTSELDLEPTEERKAEINARLVELDAEEAAQSAPLQPAITLGYNPNVFSRLTQVEWGGSLNNYIYSTIVSGRPVSSAYWEEPMPNWAQLTGGPLRSDQVQDVTNFILNFDKGADWTVDDLLAVKQFPKVPTDPAITAQLQQQVELLQQSGGVLPVYVGIDTPLSDIMAGLADVTGDPQRGDILYHGQGQPLLPCSTCHTTASLAPLVGGTWTRVTETRLNDPAVQALGITTGDEYLADSIIHPAEYHVPNYENQVMPTGFGQLLTYQDLADLIAFLKTQDQVE
jgi:mono/diheme cytochrome c family protein